MASAGIFIFPKKRFKCYLHSFRFHVSGTLLEKLFGGLLIVLICPVVRVYGGNDIKFGICFPEHILKEGDEGEGSWRHELLCMSVHVVSCHSYTIRSGSGGASGLGSWLAKSNLSDWTQFHLVTAQTQPNLLLIHFQICAFLIVCFATLN